MLVPVSSAEERTMCEFLFELKKMVWSLTWDCDLKNEPNGWEPSIFPFTSYPAGGYIIYMERDLFGDERPEAAYIYLHPVLKKGVAEYFACIHDADGNYCYTIPTHCLKVHKKGSVGIGSEMGVKETGCGPERYKIYNYYFWELKREYAIYHHFNTKHSRLCTDDDLIAESASWIDSWQRKTVFLSHHALAVSKEYSDMVSALMYAMYPIGGKYEEHNTLTINSRFCITSIYDFLFTENRNWLEWEGNLQEGIEQWNKKNAEAMEASRQFTAEQAKQVIEEKILNELPMRAPSFTKVRRKASPKGKRKRR